MQIKILVTFLVILAIGCFSKLYSQDIQADKLRAFNVGLLIGFNASSFDKRIGEFGDGEKNRFDEFIRMSPMLGIHGRYQISKMFALRTEILFNSRGGSYRTESGVISIGGNGGPNYYYKNYRLNYLEVPFLGEIDFRRNASKNRLHVRFAAGVSYGILIASSLRYNGYAPRGSSTGPLVDVEEKFDVVDVDMAKESILNSVLELSFDFVNGKNDVPLFVKLRYTGSIDEVYDRDKPSSYNFRTKVNTWSLIFGVRFMKN